MAFGGKRQLLEPTRFEGTRQHATTGERYLARGPGLPPNCHGRSVWALAQQYGRPRPGERATNRHGGLDAAAAALGYSTMQVLQNAIAEYCAG